MSVLDPKPKFANRCIVKRTTLILLVRGNPITHVLLGYKKRGFGAGKYTGIGGKIDPGETVREAAIREMHEETGVVMSPCDLAKAGHVAFYFPARPNWNLTTRIFVGRNSQGRPMESREIRPEWFAVDHLPFGDMWDDASYWYPQVLKGQRVKAVFTFASDCETVVNSKIDGR